MRLMAAMLSLALVPPLLLFVVALGPVVLGILCAVGFGLIVTTIINAVIGAGLVGRSLEKRGMRLIHHG